MRRRKETSRENPAGEGTLDALHEWVLSLPWVVERPYGLGTPGVRSFAVDCEPLGIRQVWLVTGHPYGLGVAVVVPVPLAAELETTGQVRVVAPMPAGHVFVRVVDEAEDRDMERVVVAAYAAAMG